MGDPLDDLKDNGGVDDSLLPKPGGDGPSDQDMEGLWNAGSKEREKGEPIGQFQVTIKEATLGRSTSSGRVQIHYKLECMNGEGAGQTLHKYDGLGTPKQVSITQQQLKRIGVDVDKLSIQKLPAALLDLQGKVIAVTARKSGDFYNIFFNRLVTTDTGAADPSKPF